MNSAQTSNRSRRRRRWLVILATILLALTLAGCGQQVAPYWPALSVEGTASEEGTVYIAQANGQIIARRAANGAEMWSYPLVEERKGGLLSGCSGPSASDGPFYTPPAFDQEHVYLSSGGEQQQSLFGGGENHSGLRALNKRGTLQWDFRGATDRSVAPPAVTDTTTYLTSSDHHVYAIDLETQQTRWSFKTGNWVWSTPLVIDDRVYVASMDHSLYAIDDTNGAQIWQFTGAPGALASAPAHAQGILYVGSLSGRMYAVRAEDGTQIWEKELDGGVWATPRLYLKDGQEASALYIGTLNGMVYALDPQDGSELWKQEVPGEVRGTPAYVQGKLYVGCEDGRLYTFDASNGRPGISLLGAELGGAAIYASPVFDGEQLYVAAASGQVFALDPDRDVILWPLYQEREEK